MQSIIDWIVGLMETLGAPGVGIAILLENLFPPIPSEVVLPLAGFTVAQGSLNMVSVFIWSVLGSVIGAYILYGVGAWLGLGKMNFLTFGLWTTLGSGIWNAILIYLGYILGDNWEKATEYADTYSNVIYVVLILIILGFLVFFIRRALSDWEAKKADTADTTK